MKDYWDDLTEKERAALTTEEMVQFEAVELMRLGVLRVEPFTPEPVPEVPEPSARVYRMNVGAYSSLDVAFSSAEAAEAFLKLAPLYVTNEYVNGAYVQTVAPLPASTSVFLESVRTKEEALELRQRIADANAVKERNAKGQREHEEEAKKQEEALTTIRANYYDCLAHARKVERIARVFSEYTATANGDTEVARKFLCKAFTPDEIAMFDEWTAPDTKAA